jgi:hypothetical protein
MFEQGGLLGQRGVEEPGLVGGDQIITYSTISSNIDGRQGKEVEGMTNSWGNLREKINEPVDRKQ